MYTGGMLILSLPIRIQQLQQRDHPYRAHHDWICLVAWHNRSSSFTLLPTLGGLYRSYFCRQFHLYSESHSPKILLDWEPLVHLHTYGPASFRSSCVHRMLVFHQCPVDIKRPTCYEMVMKRDTSERWSCSKTFGSTTDSTSGS